MTNQLEIGKIYTRGDGIQFIVKEYSPGGVCDLNYYCSDSFYRTIDGKAFEENDDPKAYLYNVDWNVL